VAILSFRGWQRDEPPRDVSTGEIIENGITALLNWRPHILSSSSDAPADDAGMDAV